MKQGLAKHEAETVIPVVESSVDVKVNSVDDAVDSKYVDVADEVASDVDEENVKEGRMNKQDKRPSGQMW